MRKFLVPAFLLSAVFLCGLFSSCKNDSYLAEMPTIKDQSFVEEFDTMQSAYNRGWRWYNRSTPIGTTNWSAGPGLDIMSAYSSKGTNSGFAFSDYQATDGTNDGIISNWLVSPTVTMQNGDKIVFYTKTQMTSLSSGGRDYSCRLQVRINRSTDVIVGDGENTGNFNQDSALLDINPLELENLVNTPVADAYPSGWTRFEARVLGLNAPVKGHFAFRYYLHDAGSNGNGNGVGIDSVAYISAKH
jgi:hypothetical protein